MKYAWFHGDTKASQDFKSKQDAEAMLEFESHNKDRIWVDCGSGPTLVDVDELEVKPV